MKKKMTKAELSNKLSVLENTKDYANYEPGSAWQQKHALLAQQYIESYPDSTLTDDETAALIFALNEDLQVRDYAMGLIQPTDNHAQAWYTLMLRAPIRYKSAQACLASNVRYEQELRAEAIMLLTHAKETYPLAQLLKRVYAAGWEPKEFSIMRKEIHPKVKAAIFAEVN